MAKAWFERGAEQGDRECLNGLGIMYRDGLIPGVKADMTAALSHFNAAAGQELAEAQVNIGKYHFPHKAIQLVRIGPLCDNIGVVFVCIWCRHLMSWK